MDALQIIIALVLIAWTIKNLIDSIHNVRRLNQLDDIANELSKTSRELEVLKTGMKARMEFLQLFVDEAKRRTEQEQP